MKSNVVVSGSIAIDRIMNFDGRYEDLIRADSLDNISLSVFLQSMADTYGGVGANIAYSLALLGDAPVLLGSVGKDAREFMDKLSSQGVDTSHIHRSDLPTAAFNVITDSAQSQIGGFYPGAMFDSDSLSLAPWKDENPIVVVSPHDPKAMKRQVQECAKWSLRLCYDIGQQVNNMDAEDMREGIKAAHILILNEYEISQLSDKTGLSVAEIKSSVPIVITTKGKDGSIIEGAEVSKPLTIGIVPPTSVVDPTGAGDAFRAGFLYGFARDWPLKTCAQLGATCATFAVESMGTQAHQFTFADVAKRYEKTFNEALERN